MTIKLVDGHTVIVDDQDEAIVRRFAWRFIAKSGKPYVVRRYRRGKSRQWAYLHRDILGLVDGEIADHVNGDTLDNRRSNLRACTPLENSRNKDRIRSRNRSGFKGVDLTTDKRRTRPWRATIAVDGVKVHLGYFSSAEEAAAAYDAAALRHFGDFARLNGQKGAQHQGAQSKNSEQENCVNNE